MENFKPILLKTTKQIGRKLTLSETNTLYYIYADLEMNPDLIEYLITYCVGKNKTSFHYIKAVADAWVEKGILTVEEAKTSENIYFNLCYQVLKTMNISGRYPATIELAYCERWNKEWGFSKELILEAARRTISATHNASFAYCEGILTRWKKHEITAISQLKELDEAHEERSKQAKQRKKENTFNNMKPREQDYEELEKKLLQIDMK